MKAFESFRLDLGNETLWRDGQRIPLTPKAFALLAILIENSGKLLTQHELIESLWPDTYVQPEVLKTHIRDLRSALGDDARMPRFIDTHHRRGYRFIATVSEIGDSKEKATSKTSSSFIGQERYLEILHTSFQEACAGHPQLVFLTGEVGIGKSSLANSFEKELLGTVFATRVVRGQCIERFAAHEPYYPLLQSIATLLRMPGHEAVAETLALHAPTWMLQFPACAPKDLLETLRQDTSGSGSLRMLRELCEAMNVISRDKPLVLIIEDIHWADPLTIDWLNAFACGTKPAKLMVIVTVRPVALALSGSPLKILKRRLLARKLCLDVEMAPLTEHEVKEFLESQAPSGQIPKGLTNLVFRHSEGNPFFLSAIIEHLFDESILSVESGRWTVNGELESIPQIVPETLRQLLEAHVDLRLSEPQRRILEVASISGARFTAAVVASPAGESQENVEEICQELARGSHVVRALEATQFPSGSSSSQFEFVHSLYREIFRRRISSARKARIHRLIAERVETLHEGQLVDVAPTLAYHYEKGLEPLRAIQFLLIAAEREAKCFAYRNAAKTLEHATDILPKDGGNEFQVIGLTLHCRLAEMYSLTDRFPSAIEHLKAAEESATLLEDHRARVEVLTCLAIMQCRFSGDECVAHASSALEVSHDVSDVTVRARARMSAFFWRVTCLGWNEQYVAECEAALADLKQSGSPIDFAQAQTYFACLQLFSSEYSRGLETLGPAMRILAYSGDAAYRGAQATEVVLLLLDGRWGLALDRVHDNIRASRKDFNQTRECIMQVYQAWIYHQLLDFSASVELCRQALPCLAGSELRWAQRICLIFQGASEASLGRLHDARHHLNDAAAPELDHGWLGWYWRLPRYLAQVDLEIQSGRIKEAQDISMQLISEASRTAERTWCALAWEAQARVNLADDNLPQARKSIETAVSLMEGYHLPLAKLRVHRTAMQIIPERLAHHRQLAAQTLSELADSLGDYSELRESFLTSKEMTALL